MIKPCVWPQVFYGSRRQTRCVLGSEAFRTMEQTWESQSGGALEWDARVKINIPAQRAGYCGWPLEGANDALAASEARSSSEPVRALGAFRSLHEHHFAFQARCKTAAPQKSTQCNSFPA